MEGFVVRMWEPSEPDDIITGLSEDSPAMPTIEDARAWLRSHWAPDYAWDILFVSRPVITKDASGRIASVEYPEEIIESGVCE